MNLNTGSIDLIQGLDEQFYFLEVNPVGQYSMVDVPCNYKLNQIIATKLIELDHEKSKNQSIARSHAQAAYSAS